jgi:hypothetical protein
MACQFTFIYAYMKIINSVYFIYPSLQIVYVGSILMVSRSKTSFKAKFLSDIHHIS